MKIKVLTCVFVQAILYEQLDSIIWGFLLYCVCHAAP